MPIDRQTHWDRVYTTKAADAVSWYEPHAEVSLRLIRATGIDPAARIINIGAGVSPLAGDLLDRGYKHVAVLDISPAALAEARARLGARAEQITWIEGDVTTAPLPGRFDLWHDRAVLHFLTEPEDRQRYRAALLRGLAPGGHVVIGAFAPDGPERCSGLPVFRYDEARMAEVLGPEFVLRSSERGVHRTPSGAEQRFAWFWLQRAEAS